MAPSEGTLDGSEDRFFYLLRSLHEISLDLTGQTDPDRFCKMAVSWGLSNLGFDRMSLWFIDPRDPGWSVGTWGTDEEGRLRDERSARVPRDPIIAPPEFYEGQVPVLYFRDSPCFDEKRTPIGRADKALAPLWDGKEIIGELAVDNFLTGRTIGPRDLDILVLFARIVAHLHTLVVTRATLARMGEDRGTLLREIKHRTRNNLNMIQGLVFLEASKAVSDETKTSLAVLRDRIGVLGSLYDLLDQEADEAPLRLDEYLGTVATRLAQAYGADHRGIALELDLKPLVYDEKKAGALGIVLNELMTDSFKYAFSKGRTGRILVRLEVEGARGTLEIRDDGPGLSPDFDLDRSQGLGLRLVTALVRQVSGSITCRTDGGAVFTLEFPLD